MPCLPQIRREPGDVEIPAIGQEEILETEQPYLFGSNQFSPGHMAVPGSQMLARFDHPHFSRIDALVIAGIVAIPAVEHDRPNQSDPAEQLEGVPPGHYLQYLHHQKRSERSSPAG